MQWPFISEICHSLSVKKQTHEKSRATKLQNQTTVDLNQQLIPAANLPYIYLGTQKPNPVLLDTLTREYTKIYSHLIRSINNRTTGLAALGETRDDLGLTRDGQEIVLPSIVETHNRNTGLTVHGELEGTGEDGKHGQGEMDGKLVMANLVPQRFTWQGQDEQLTLSKSGM